MVSLGETPYFAIYDHAYSTSADLTNNSDEFTSWLRSNVRANITVSSGSAGYFMSTYIGTYETTTGQSSTTNYLEHTTSDIWCRTKYAVGNMTGWNNTTCVGALLWARDNEPLDAGTALRLNINGKITQMFLQTLDGSSSYAQQPLKVDYINVWCTNSTLSSSIRLCTYDDDTGCWITPIKAKYFIVTFRLGTVSKYYSNTFAWPTGWTMYQDMGATYTHQITVNNTNETQQQTETLTNTEGSSGIVSGVQGQGQTISDRLGFVSQTAGFVSSIVNAVSGGSAQDGVTFPGISWDGNVIVASQSVNILGWLGSEIEGTVKAFCTMLVFLAWISGLRGLYHKIFLGEVEVEVMDE